jgi:hypothetical protein
VKLSENNNLTGGNTMDWRMARIKDVLDMATNMNWKHSHFSPRIWTAVSKRLSEAIYSTKN